MDMKIGWEDETCLHQASSSLRYYRCPIKRKRLRNERSLPTKPAATRLCQEKTLQRVPYNSLKVRHCKLELQSRISD